MSDPINSLKIDAWGTGKRNDCWWNIAKNQLDDGASAAEIMQLMEEIVLYNEKKTGKEINLNDVIYAGQEVFIPIEQSIDEIQSEVSDLNSQYTELNTQYESQVATLETANADVASALEALCLSQNSLNSIDENKNPNDYQNALDEVSKAKEEYQNALQKQNEAQKELESIKRQVNSKKEEIELTSEELVSLQKELEDEKEDKQPTIDKIQDEIDKLQNSIEETSEQKKLLERQASAEAESTRLQEQAANLGAIDEKGETATAWTPDSEKIAAAVDENKQPANSSAGENGKSNAESMYAADSAMYGAEVENELIDGRRTRRIKYEDGTVIEYHKDPETGEFSLKGTTYNTDGTVTYSDGRTYDPTTGTFAESGQINGSASTYPSGTGYRDDEYWKNVNSEEYSSEYLNGLINEYNTLMAPSSTDKNPQDAEKILNEIDTYIGNISQITELENSDDNPELKELLNTYKLTNEYKNMLSQGISSDDAQSILDLKLAMLSSQAELISYAEQVYNVIDTLSPTQMLITSTDTDVTKNYLSVVISNVKDSNEMYSLTNNIYLGMDASAVNQHAQSALEAYEAQMQEIDNIYNNLDIDANVQNQDKYSEDDLNKVIELYDVFMQTTWEKSAGWWGSRPDGVSKAKDEAEKLIKYALAGGEYPGSIDFEQLIRAMQDLNEQYK